MNVDPWRQFYSPVNNDEDTESELVLDDAVKGLTLRAVKQEDERELTRKFRVLEDIHALFNKWVRECGAAAGVSDVNGRPIEGRLETSGSWRLGIHEKDADIDLICVAPRFCDLSLFFSTFQEMISTHPDVTNFAAIPGAFVPIMTFDFRRVNVDLLLAVLPHVNTVPPTFDLLNDSVLSDMEEKSRLSLNGPRDTLTIERLVRRAGSSLTGKQDPPDAHERYERFLRTVRVVRTWAKRRCLYSNKMGYLGGINFNIMMAMIIQMYPRKGPGALLLKFFETLSRWPKLDAEHPGDKHGGVRWKAPVQLCAVKKNGSRLDSVVYPYTRFGESRGDMPVVTPSYPAFNSAGNVNPWTLRILNEELNRGMEILKRAQEIANVPQSGGKAVAALAACMDALVAPCDFFWRLDHEHFLALHVTKQGSSATEEEDAALFNDFKGMSEAMFRQIVSSDRYKNLGSYPIARIHLLPKKFEGKDLGAPPKPPPPKPSGEGQGGGQGEGQSGAEKAASAEAEAAALAGDALDGSLTMWVSFSPDKARPSERLEVGALVSSFERSVKERFERDHPGQANDFAIRPRYFKQKDLPFWVHSLGDIGHEQAAQLRKQRKKELKELKKKQLAAKSAAAAPETLEESGALRVASPAGMQEALAPGLAAAAEAGDPQRGDKLSAAAASPEYQAGRAAAAAAAKEAAEAAAQAVKPLWLAVEEAHARLPILSALGDVAVRTPLGAYVAAGPRGSGRVPGETAMETEEGRPLKRIRKVFLLS